MAIDPNNVTQGAPEQVSVESAPPPTMDDTQALPPTPVGPPASQTAALTPVSATGGQQPFAPPPEHHNILGQLVHGLFTGENVSYDRDETGKLITTREKQKPGQLLRSILIGGLLGASAGATDPSHTFAGGAARGAGAVIMDQRQQDELKRKQATEDYQARLQGKVSAREDEKMDLEKRRLTMEEKEAQSRQQASLAQTLHMNAATKQLVMVTQGASLKTHEEVLGSHAADVALFKSMHLDPVFKNKTESEMNDFIQKRPDAAGMIWRVTDVKMGKDADGNATWEYEFSAYNLKKEVPVSKDVLKKWKDNGVADTYPDVLKQLKAGSTIDADHYKTFTEVADKDYIVNYEKTKAQVGLEHVRAETTELRARGVLALAEADKSKLDRTQRGAFKEAMDDYSKNNQDFSKITDEHKAILADHATEHLKVLWPEYNTAVQSGDSKAAAALYHQIEDLRAVADAGSPKAVKPLPPLDVSKVGDRDKFSPKGENKYLFGPDGRTMNPAAEGAFNALHEALIKANPNATADQIDAGVVQALQKSKWIIGAGPGSQGAKLKPKKWVSEAVGAVAPYVGVVPIPQIGR